MSRAGAGEFLSSGLRWGFDAVLALSADAPAVFTAEAAGSPVDVEPLVTLKDAKAAAMFRAVNDGVMGGTQAPVMPMAAKHTFYHNCFYKESS